MILKAMKADRLSVLVYDTRKEMGKAAGAAAAEAIRAVLAQREYANVIFAAAPSQNEMLDALLSEDLDFTRINAFHMDEYIGLSIENAQSFARYLTDHLFSRAPFRSVHLIPAKESVEAACAAYTDLLTAFPPDVVCMGIGENGHIAFNDPPVADFNDPVLIKSVALDEICRNQQVHDGCFPSLDKVPTHALTLTVPALMSAGTLICTVPASTKAAAVKATLCGTYGTHCPATALRKHPSAQMFLDRDSASEVL